MDQAICSICLDPLSAPIIQCQSGHSYHGACIQANNIVSCPECRGPMSTTRNYALENVMEKRNDLKYPCFNSDRGCKYLLSLCEKPHHELECKFRISRCEGSTFAKWNCLWIGPYTDIISHFQKEHPHTKGNFKMDLEVPLRLDTDSLDLKVIPYFEGAQIFWYKYKIDTVQQKMFWTFQMIGTAKQAENFYYEFEIISGPIRKFKVTEICGSDSMRSDQVFKDGRCVCLSFEAAKAYADQKGRLHVKFRVMSNKKIK